MVNQKTTFEIKKFLEDEAKKMGKNFSWFRFAKKTKTGCWRFLANKDDQWEKLQEIANKLSLKYEDLKKGEIVDIISELVNN